MLSRRCVGRFTRKVQTSIEYDGHMYWVEVTLDCTPGSPGRISGDPDNCYPPEPDMGEPTDIVVLEANEGGDNSLVGQHVDWKIDFDNLVELTGWVFEEQADANDAAYEAYCEAKLDAMREGDR